MKYFYLFVFTSLLSQAIWASQVLSPNINVDLTMNYKINNQESNIHNSLKFQSLNQWMPLGGLNSCPQIQPSSANLPPINPAQIILLSKIEKADHHQIVLKILLIDQSLNSTYILEPTMILKYKQKGEMKIHQKNQTIHIKAVAMKS